MLCGMPTTLPPDRTCSARGCNTCTILTLGASPGGFDMGAAVPVAEPRWSGAHQGLALFLARLLAPLGDRPLAVPVDPRRPDGMLGGTLPPTGLQVRRSTGGRLSTWSLGPGGEPAR
jgi:hypothetical protein